MTTQKQKQPDNFTNAGKAPGGDRARKTGETHSWDQEPAQESRFDKERQDRDRSAFEGQNQGQGPSNVGDQSRTR